MYSHLFVAGTFDTFHKGHEAILTRAFGEGEMVTIGITSDQYIEKFKKFKHKTFLTRKRNIETWLEKHGFIKRSTIIAINDPYDPAASDPRYNALIVTAENNHRGEEINAMRENKGLIPLALITVPYVNAEDGMPISSTRIRTGTIDPDGKLVMPEILRETLAAPLGHVLSKWDVPAHVNAKRGTIIISVGDITTTKIMQLGIVPTLSIIDLKVRRKAYQSFEDYRFPETTQVEHIQSGPGHISHEATDAVKQWATSFQQHKNTVFIVDGEEDLMTLPAIVYAPIGSAVYYGQPDIPFFLSGVRQVKEGMVEVEVTKKVKMRAMELLAKFEKVISSS